LTDKVVVLNNAHDGCKVESTANHRLTIVFRGDTTGAPLVQSLREVGYNHDHKHTLMDKPSQPTVSFVVDLNRVVAGGVCKELGDLRVDTVRN
jgi:hypothetical protein